MTEGVYMLRYKQSSDNVSVGESNGSNDDASGTWMHIGGYFVACSVSDHALGGRGVSKRRLPTGGVANGIPRKTRVELWPSSVKYTRFDDTLPYLVCTVNSAIWKP